MKNEITQATIARGTNRETHQVFYVVKSDSAPNTWYQVTWSDERTAWECDCPSHTECKHRRAVQEILKLRRASIALATTPVQPAPRREYAALNGTREFNLMR